MTVSDNLRIYCDSLLREFHRHRHLASGPICISSQNVAHLGG